MSSDKKSAGIFRRLFGKNKSAKQDNAQNKSNYHNLTVLDRVFRGYHILKPSSKGDEL